jgi:hypothetical protein
MPQAGGAPGRAVSTASRARFHVAVRLPINGSAANTACSRTCALTAEALVGRERRRHEQSPAPASSRDRDRGIAIAGAAARPTRKSNHAARARRDNRRDRDVAKALAGLASACRTKQSPGPAQRRRQRLARRHEPIHQCDTRTACCGASTVRKSCMKGVGASTVLMVFWCCGVGSLTAWQVSGEPPK